ncbi:MAG: AFG1 family ATPase [Nitratireductor sp.]|nr:AFG1 family ATPase [Nitratireductor sp.]
MAGPSLDPSGEGPVSERLSHRIAKGEIEADPVQIALAAELDALARRIEDRALASKSSSLGWLFSRRQKAEPVRGMYIHGAVGRGKSMLMDLFFQSVSLKAKRRVHFHDFMADAQDRIHQQRQDFKQGRTREQDPIAPVARQLASQASLLCFDEFSVTDIADAMILGRLFKALFEHGTVIVATSNVAPGDLYRDGLNRQLFLPFIDILIAHCEVRHLDARTDYRLENLTRLPVYITPLGKTARQQIEAIWQNVTGGAAAPPAEIRIKGRVIPVPMAAAGAARFTFSGLCEEPLGARDYLAIARAYHTLVVENVPQMNIARRNPAKRFINLIDTLYDTGTRLVLSAAAPPEGLYTETAGVEAFEFARTVSRLHEMQSESYLSAAGRAPPPDGKV